MNTNSELQNHIICEFYSSSLNRENIINESRGIVGGLHDIVKTLAGDMYGQVRKTCADKTDTVRTYIGRLSKRGLSSFFDEYKIIVTTTFNQNTDGYGGGFSPSKSFVDTSNGVVCSPDIVLNVKGANVTRMMYIIEFALGHELTHAYNMLQYANNNGLTANQILRNILDTQRYAKNKFNRDYGHGNEKAVAFLLYYLNRMERNAYLAQLKQELEVKSDNITDSQSAWKAVLESESYKKFKSIEKNVGIILGPGVTDPAQDEILKTTNEITGKNFKNYNQLKKYYIRYWDVWKKKYLSTATKIVYDIFAEKNQIIGGLEPSDFSIKPD